MDFPADPALPSAAAWSRPQWKLRAFLGFWSVIFVIAIGICGMGRHKTVMEVKVSDNSWQLSMTSETGVILGCIFTIVLFIGPVCHHCLIHQEQETNRRRANIFNYVFFVACFLLAIVLFCSGYLKSALMVVIFGQLISLVTSGFRNFFDDNPAPLTQQEPESSAIPTQKPQSPLIENQEQPQPTSHQPNIPRTMQRSLLSVSVPLRQQLSMYWKTQVDNLMSDIYGNHLTAAAIIGRDGSVWAKSDNFPQLNPEEVNGIIKDFAEPGYLAPSLYLGSVKYIVIQGEPGAIIRGKKGSAGVTIQKTNLAFVIGLYEDPLTHIHCNMIVEKIGNFLIDQGI